MTTRRQLSLGLRVVLVRSSASLALKFFVGRAIVAVTLVPSIRSYLGLPVPGFVLVRLIVGAIPWFDRRRFGTTCYLWRESLPTTGRREGCFAHPARALDRQSMRKAQSPD